MGYYTAKVQLTDVVDTPKGTKEKRSTETYLVEALSVTEAEAKVVADFKAGDTVIVTFEDANRVAVILDSFLVNKKTMYDILLENRSAMTMVNTASSNRTYINRTLTKLLCDSDQIVTTIPYKELLENDALPIVRA